MHIPDGILPLPLTLGGYAACAAAVFFCLHRIKKRPEPAADIPKAALLTSAFFVASLIHIPVPPASVHLMLSGLLGVLLGFFAIPAILIGLFFQAVMFGHGGLTTLGINGVIIGFPAMAAHYIFRFGTRGKHGPKPTATFAFLAGALAIMLSVLLFALLLVTAVPADMGAAVEKTAMLVIIAAHVPLALVEGVITAMTATFLLRVSPRVLHGV
ncbi:cobalt transporter CbiM [Desulfonatronospira sp.]|uniref:cobalt transporter CbiM n=1 Tax=Desulfonatronospira sp. TaxID=1962951 RepID=UPI0025C640AB|nr:cobalt transporter CbiM [Desulfonatronospira sp.]